MAVRLLLTVGPYVVLDVELFRRGEAGGEPAGSVSQLAAGELADPPVDGLSAFGVRVTRRPSDE